MPWPLVAAGRSVRRGAVDADVEVIVVSVARGGLREQSIRAIEHGGRRPATPPLSEKAALDGRGDEDVLHSSIAIGDELGDELPIASVIEAKGLVRGSPLTLGIEAGEAEGVEGPAARVGHVERDVDVSSVLMRCVAGDSASA